MSIELTEEQQANILKAWNDSDDPPALLELIRAAYPNENYDGRTKEGRAVKKFLASRQIVADGAHVYKPKNKVELTEEQKEYTSNNVSVMSAVEIARIIFNDNSLSNLNQESRAVADYINTLDNKVIYSDPTSDVPQSPEYKPPKTALRMTQRVNKYVHEGLEEGNLKAVEKKGIEALIGYLHTFRFLHQINNYENQNDRDLFESSFIRYTYDKPDLTQEEVDQYIVLSTEVVIAANIQRRKEHLTQLLDNTVEDTDGRASMSLVEVIGKIETEYNQSVNRQQKLLGDLKEKRSDRLSKQVKENASILNLVQMWKEEESRKKMIHLAELRKQVIKEEVERLSSMDEIKCRIMGLSEDEALDG
jgi:hypothetical protein|tara:strand:- start:10298 stop:11383 length:1086 start_codon:yes stop_codon:yes gene_type:complete